MKLSKHYEDDRILIHVDSERIDAACSIQFKDLMRRAILEVKGPALIDLSAVRFIDSSGLGAIVSIKKNAWNRPGYGAHRINP